MDGLLEKGVFKEVEKSSFTNEERKILIFKVKLILDV